MVQREDMLEVLRSGSKSQRCGIYIYNLDPLERQIIYQELESKRLIAKHVRMSLQHDKERMSWNQIAFMNIMQYMGNMSNRKNYIEIARRVSFEMLQRERSSVEMMEALLIGAAGLLSTLPKDSYTENFVKDGNYLLHKYKITPLKRAQWSRAGVSFSKAPIIRLSQVAHILYNHEHLFTHVRNCRSRNDVFDLCGASASKNLSRYFGGDVTRSVGAMMCDIVAINVIVPLQYSYGLYSADEEMMCKAFSLNELLPAERNGIITGWCNSGLTPTSAYETQALLELHNSYCKENLCHECLIYQHICSKINILDRIPIFCTP